MKLKQSQHHRINTETAAIAYQSAGEGQTIVLIHGWPQHSLMWHAIAPVLIDSGFRVLLPDLRGSGASSIPDGGYDKTTMATDIVAILDAEEISEAFVFGYDLGAGVSAALARDYPQRVKKLAVAEFGLANFGY